MDEMDAVVLIGILTVSGCVIVGTVWFANVALNRYMHGNKGIHQNSAEVLCPQCGERNRRQKNGQQCVSCYFSF